MSRLQIVLLDAEERETGRFDHETEHRYTLNELVEHPDDGDVWLVCAVEPAEPPYSERVAWIYVGRTDAERNRANRS